MSERHRTSHSELNCIKFKSLSLQINRCIMWSRPIQTRRLTKLATRCYSNSTPSLVKVLASDSIEGICGATFKSRGHELVEMPGIKKDELIKVIADYEGLVVRSGTKVTREIIDAGVNLKVIGRAGTGVDNIDVPYATNKGILVVNTPGGNTVSTAELAVAHIMSLARNVSQGTSSLKAGQWNRSKLTGSELHNKVLGIVGIGKIGKEVARCLKGLGMKVIGYDPIMSSEAALSAGITSVSLEELFSACDFISLHTPLTKETENLFNAANIAKCKQGVRIVNCARGGIVNEADLLEALNSGHVAGAALDTFVTEPPTADSLALRTHPKTVISPHLGASTEDAQDRVARAIAENMSDIYDGGSFFGVVNAPDLGAVKKDPRLVPFVSLAEMLGSIQGQLLGNAKMHGMTISLSGKDISDPKATEVIKAAVIKGALSQLVSQPVTMINAIALAEDMGMNIAVNLSEAPGSMYRNTMTVELGIEGMLNMSRVVEGTTIGQNQLRVTSIDGYPLDCPPSDYMLMFNNYDRPGVLKRICEKLADAKVNIANFALGRKEKGKVAMGVLNIDTSVPEDVLLGLAKYADISNVFQIELKSPVDPNFRVNTTVSGIAKPQIKPRNPEFSSGPCKKRPGYDLASLRTDVLGRSHRSKLGKSRLQKAIFDTKSILGIPDDYHVGIVPASDTGAYEMAMWNLLGERPIDACYHESFGKGWHEDAIKHLGLKDSTREFSAEYGQLPDFANTNPDHDIMFTFNGTTSGVRVPNLDWVSADRKGLTLNDATSAAFAMDIEWSKCDVTTYSWQKVLGGEGAHGMLIMSPQAVERLETFKHNRPLPKIFRMLKKGKLDEAIFKGDTINTPSMLCVEDYLDALKWAEAEGGLQGLIARSKSNLGVLEAFVAQNDWIHFLAKDPATRSNTSVCLTLDLGKDQVKQFIALLEKEGVAYDIGAYRDAPDGLRIWCGATVEQEDVEALMPWLKWAYETVANK